MLRNKLLVGAATLALAIFSGSLAIASASDAGPATIPSEGPGLDDDLSVKLREEDEGADAIETADDDTDDDADEVTAASTPTVATADSTPTVDTAATTATADSTPTVDTAATSDTAPTANDDDDDENEDDDDDQETADTAA